MRAALIVVFVAALATSARSEPWPWTHVRPTSTDARQLLDLAVERSSVVRALLDELERTDVVALLVFSKEPVPDTATPFMGFVGATAETRYVVIHLFWKCVPPAAFVPMLAHELQHARELAAATEVRDRESFKKLFRAIGWSVGPNRFETEGARTVEMRVRHELAGMPPA